MRALILVAGAALALSACGNNDQADNTANVDENLTAENIVSNDVTAIDAVTGDAANMAADVDVNYTNDLAAANELGSGSNAAAPASNTTPSPRKPAPGKPPIEQPTPPEPVTNNAT